MHVNIKKLLKFISEKFEKDKINNESLVKIIEIKSAPRALNMVSCGLNTDKL